MKLRHLEAADAPAFQRLRIEGFALQPREFRYAPEDEADMPLAEVAARLRRQAPEKKLGVEVGSVAAAGEAIGAGFDVIQLEKFSPALLAEVAALARACKTPPLVAAAGGVTLANAADYVRAGAGLIVTSAPYAASPREVQVRIEATG